MGQLESLSLIETSLIGFIWMMMIFWEPELYEDDAEFKALLYSAA
jgi:hypothetical protein